METRTALSIRCTRSTIGTHDLIHIHARLLQGLASCLYGADIASHLLGVGPHPPSTARNALIRRNIDGGQRTGYSVGEAVGEAVGDVEGDHVGEIEGVAVGDALGAPEVVGEALGTGEGRVEMEGDMLGYRLGDEEDQCSVRQMHISRRRASHLIGAPCAQRLVPLMPGTPDRPKAVLLPIVHSSQ